MFSREWWGQSLSCGITEVPRSGLTRKILPHPITPLALRSDLNSSKQGWGGLRPPHPHHIPPAHAAPAVLASLGSAHGASPCPHSSSFCAGTPLLRSPTAARRAQQPPADVAPSPPGVKLARDDVYDACPEAIRPEFKPNVPSPSRRNREPDDFSKPQLPLL